jgi:hypothetical protein
MRPASEGIERSAQQESSLKFDKSERQHQQTSQRLAAADYPIDAIRLRSRQWNRVANARWWKEDYFSPMRDGEKKRLKGRCGRTKVGGSEKERAPMASSGR